MMKWRTYFVGSFCFIYSIPSHFSHDSFDSTDCAVVPNCFCFFVVLFCWRKNLLLFEVFLSLLIYSKHAFKFLTNDKTINKAGAPAGAAEKERESLIGRFDRCHSLSEYIKRNQNKRIEIINQKIVSFSCVCQFVCETIGGNNGQWTNYMKALNSIYYLLLIMNMYKRSKFILFISLVYCLVIVPMFPFPFQTLF